MQEAMKPQCLPENESKMFSKRKEIMLRRRTSLCPFSISIESHSRSVEVRESITWQKNKKMVRRVGKKKMDDQMSNWNRKFSLNFLSQATELKEMKG